MDLPLNEQVLRSWVELTSIFKNPRLTEGMTYNESAVMLFIYERFQRTGAAIPLRELLAKTRMTKSLLHRTLASLLERGLIRKQPDGENRRSVCVSLQPEKLADFIAVHEKSLALVDQVIDIIGAEDAQTFVRISGKLIEENL
ncbi:MAG: MarR family transcriptional regulator [Firmicutes bacterium]|nr:MarR family transcriptional regulator [Bacillota bacterium]